MNQDTRNTLISTVVFLEDYLRTTTHPGVSRLVGDLRSILLETSDPPRPSKLELILWNAHAAAVEAATQVARGQCGAPVMVNIILDTDNSLKALGLLPPWHNNPSVKPL